MGEAVHDPKRTAEPNCILPMAVMIVTIGVAAFIAPLYLRHSNA